MVQIKNVFATQKYCMLRNGYYHLPNPHQQYCPPYSPTPRTTVMAFNHTEARVSTLVRIAVACVSAPVRVAAVQAVDVNHQQ